MALREKTILFIDDAMIAEQQELALQPQAAIKHAANPVLSPTFAWEIGGVSIFGSVIREPETGLFRMWYQAIDQEDSHSPDHMTICYAESNDGIHWHKPLLDISGYRERKASNIVLGNAVYPGNPYCASVIRDDDAQNPDERYKMAVWYEQWTDGLAQFNGAATFHSPDGLHWRIYEGAKPYISVRIRVTPEEVRRYEGPNDVTCISPDKLDGQFVSWQVVRQYIAKDKRIHHRDLLATSGLERVLAMQTSSDFVHWTEPRKIIVPTSEDPDYLQFYGMGGFRYGNYWLGTLWTYYVHDQSMDLELALSRDGYHWTRPFPGHRLVSLGEAGAFDCGMIESATSPLVVGDEIYIYYGGSNHRHDEQGTAAIGLATLKIDRWAGLQTGRRGLLVTRPFTFNGTALTLNAYAHGGEVRAELLDEHGQTIPGFELERAMPVVGDHTAQRLAWEHGSDMSALRGRRIAVRFEILNATLYAISQV